MMRKTIRQAFRQTLAAWVILSVVTPGSVFGQDGQQGSAFDAEASNQTAAEAVDHKDDKDYTSTLELQLGKMFTPRVGVYAEALLGDDVFKTDFIDTGVGVGMRFMY